jgi:hypothetical protein
MSERAAPWAAMTPEDSPKTPPDLMADPVHRDLSTAKLAVGEEAFKFVLPVRDFSDGAGRATGGTFDLGSEAQKRPVALIFGSYT